MRKHSTILFWAGLAIAISGFFIGQASRIPFVLRIVSAKYWNAKVGYEKLCRTGKLSVGEVGFSEIENIKLQDLAKYNTPEQMSHCHILNFSCVPTSWAVMTSDNSPTFTAMPIECHFSNLQIGNWNSKDIEEKIGNLKESGILLFSVIVFIVGVFVQIFSWWLKRLDPIKTALSQDIQKQPSPNT